MTERRLDELATGIADDAISTYGEINIDMAHEYAKGLLMTHPWIKQWICEEIGTKYPAEFLAEKICAKA